MWPFLCDLVSLSQLISFTFSEQGLFRRLGDTIGNFDFFSSKCSPVLKAHLFELFHQRNEEFLARNKSGL